MMAELAQLPGQESWLQRQQAAMNALHAQQGDPQAQQQQSGCTDASSSGLASIQEGVQQTNGVAEQRTAAVEQVLHHQRLLHSQSGINALPELQQPHTDISQNASWLRAARRRSMENNRRRSVGERDSRNGRVVLIWDLDESLILFHSLINGAFAKAHGPEVAQAATALGQRWQEAILDLCDDHFFFSQIEDCDQTTVTALSEWDDGRTLEGYSFTTDDYAAPNSPDGMRKLAYRFRHIVGLYAKGLENLAESLAQHEQWLSLYGDTDKLTSGWLSHGVSLLKECTERAAALAQDVSAASSRAPAGPQAERADLGQHLEQPQPPQMSYRLSISEDDGIKKRAGPQGPQGPSGPAGVQQLSPAAPSQRVARSISLQSSESPEAAHEAGVTNVLVTTGQLIPTLGKLLLFQLNQAFGATEVYSARNEGKSACFDAISKRFGLDCNFAVIGDGAEEQRCAAQRGWPFLKVALKADEDQGLSRNPKDAFANGGGPLTSMMAEHVIERAVA